MSEEKATKVHTTEFTPRVSEYAPVFRVCRWSFLVLAAVLGLMLLCAPVDRSDLWPVLRVGREILSGQLAGHSSWFRWEGHYEVALRSSWLAGSIFYLAYLVKGVNAVALLQALLVLTAFVLQGLLLFRRYGGFYAIGLAPLLAMFLGASEHSHGPEVFTFVALALLYAVHSNGWFTFKRRGIFTIILLVLWACTHPGVWMGFLFLVCEWGAARWGIVESVESEKLGDDTTTNEKIGDIAGVGLPLLLLGLSICFLAPKPLARGMAIFQLGLAPFFHQDGRDTLELLTGLRPMILIIVTAIALGIGRSKLSLTDYTRTAILGVAAVFWARDSLLFALVSVPIIGACFVKIRESVSAYLRKSPRGTQAFASQIVGLHLMANLALILAACLLPHFFRMPSLSLKPRLFPDSVAIVLRGVPVRGEIMNSPELGEYLSWRMRPEQKLLLNSRSREEQPAQYAKLMQTINLGDNWEETLKGRDAAVLTYPEKEWDPYRRNFHLRSHLARKLYESSDWKLVTWDDAALLFIRNRPEFEEFITERELKLSDPFDLKLNKSDPNGDDYTEAADEIEDLIRDRSPGRVRSLYVIGRFRLKAAEIYLDKIDRDWQERLQKLDRETREKVARLKTENPERPEGPVEKNSDTFSPFADPVAASLRKIRKEKERIRRESQTEIFKIADEINDQKGGVMSELYKSVSDILFDLPKIAPDVPESHYLQAQGLQKLDPWRSKLEILKRLARSIQLDPAYIEPRLKFVDLLTEGDSRRELSAAADHLREITNFDTENYPAAFKLARVERRLGNWKTAIRLLEALRTKSNGKTPTRKDILLESASVYELLDRYEEAAQCIAELRQETVSDDLPEGDFFLNAYLDFLKEMKPK